MGRPLVVVTDSVFPNLDPTRDVLAEIDADLVMVPEPSVEAIGSATRNADGILVTYAKISADMIRQMTRCRVISRFGIGVDNVDVAAATKAGIVVTRVPDYCLEEVADHTLALLLALARKVATANAHAHAGKWGLSGLVPMHRLRGRTLGLVGFGQIPQMVAPRAKAFGLRVITYDPYVQQTTLNAAGVDGVDLNELITTSDYISIHTPLTPETRGMFAAEMFKKMKSEAFLINTARGPIVDETALAEALDRGDIAGAALDVLPEEPPKGSPLFGRPNVILTPHVSFYSVESLVDLQRRAAKEVVRALSNENTRNPVNPEALQYRSAR
jgi:D-3-phosphoglycerate dehydrogenase / 2-oxoglutarate reductase